MKFKIIGRRYDVTDKIRDYVEKKLGKLDKFFKDDDINRIALIAPQAKINIIHDFEVVEKKVLSIPASIEGIAKCMNPACVTNHQNILTRFTTITDSPDVKLLCRYCEKITDLKNLKIISNF